MKMPYIPAGAALLLAAALTPTTAGAQDGRSTMTSYICRSVQPSERANAAMSDKSVSLTCRPFAISVPRQGGTLQTIGHVTATPVSAPDYSHALTPDQFNAAFTTWYMKAFDIPPAEGG